jgi:hypothetical protein
MPAFTRRQPNDAGAAPQRFFSDSKCRREWRSLHGVKLLAERFTELPGPASSLFCVTFLSRKRGASPHLGGAPVWKRGHPRAKRARRNTASHLWVKRASKVIGRSFFGNLSGKLATGRVRPTGGQEGRNGASRMTGGARKGCKGVAELSGTPPGAVPQWDDNFLTVKRSQNSLPIIGRAILGLFYSRKIILRL